ncbi:hypothetical protein [Actinomadura macrotermitis]|uniref:Uncharacterized protein n=1 Tax=Actinomadura macrotermitis TaxID=2585200 RepID=A0A7K0BNY2_9ACTN|nr:hypothetical protein [Actinomadura macrotermitis]MQY02885.1 hypothetical protein [Actinomadura macrotermitis]
MMAQPGAADREEDPPAAVQAATAQGLQELFPGVRVWYGKATRSWWALVPLNAGPRLIEAPTPQRLRDSIMSARTHG